MYSQYIEGGGMTEVDKLLKLCEELCGWLYIQRGMIAADYAKDLAKQLSLTKKELENARSIQDNRADTNLV